MRKLLALVLVSALVGVTGVTASAGAAPAVKDRAVIAPEVADQLAALAPGQKITVVITLSEKADLSALPGASRAARSSAAIRALQAKAFTSQMPVHAFLRARVAKGKASNVTSFWIFDGLSVTADADTIHELSLRSDVASITPDEINIVSTAGTPEPNISLVKAPALWASGYTGSGIVVASLDTGVDVSHSDLSGNWRGGSNSWFDPFGQHTTYPIDANGHGTGTMGVMVGGDNGGTSIGVAPGAQWIAARIFNDAGSSSATAIHQAFQWVLDPDGNPATLDSPQVVNNSWSFGGPGCNLEFQPDLQALRAAGIVPVFAAGNYGPNSGTSTSPANYPESLAVGAINNTSQIYASGSRGPSSCGEAASIFPEIVAPGVNIKTTERYWQYQYATGTSLAAPHVAGAIALLLSSGSSVTGVLAEQAIIGSAVDLGVTGPDNVFGNGRLDVAAAYQWLQSPPPTTTSTSTTSTSTTSTSTTSTSTTSTSTTTSSTTSTTTTTVPPANLFADGFESGTMNAWSAKSVNGGRLTVTGAAALAGNAGLQAVIVNTNPMYVADQTPNLSRNYGASFAFDPNSLVIPRRKLVDVFTALDGPATSAFRLQIQADSSGYDIRAFARGKRGRESSTSWVTISDAPHTVTVNWSAATSSGGSDGSFSLAIDGFDVATLSGLSNGDYRVNEVRVGPQSIGSAVSGTSYFDEFRTLVSN